MERLMLAIRQMVESCPFTSLSQPGFIEIARELRLSIIYEAGANRAELKESNTIHTPAN